MKSSFFMGINAISNLIVENMDFFAQQPQLRIFKKKKYSTFLGFIVTTSVISICLIQLQEQLTEIFSRKNPNVVISEQQVFNTEEYILYPSNQTFALAIVDARLQAIQGQQIYFNMTIRNCKRERIINSTSGKTSVNFECFNYPVEQCTDKDHFPTQIQKQFFQSFNKSALYCPSSQAWLNRPIKLQGTAQSDSFQYVDIQISKCINNSNYLNCSSQDQVDKILTGNYIILYTSDILSQMENAEDPFENIIQSQYYSYSRYMPKIVISSVKVIEVQTDQGLISVNMNKQFNLQQSTVKESYDYLNNQFWFQYEVVIDQKILNYKRSYVKLQNVFGSVGGLWQILILSLQIIINPITILLGQIQIANQHFRFQKQESNQDQQSFNQIGKQDIIPNSRSLIINEEIPQIDLCTKKKIHKQISKLENKLDLQKYLENKDKNYQLKSKEILQTLFCYNNPKRKQLKYAVNKIMSKLDIFYIISKLQEIDKLKFLLLTKDQINLFNYIPKPIIPLNLFDGEFQNNIKQLEQQIAFKLLLNEEKPENSKINEAFQSFQNMKSNIQASKIDQKILEFLDDEVRCIFESQTLEVSKSIRQFIDLESVSESQRPVHESINEK